MPSNTPTLLDHSGTSEQSQTAGAVQPPARTHAQRVTDGRMHSEDGKGSAPTNREPHNSNNEYFKLLRFGVDM